MNQKAILKNTKIFVKQRFEGAEGGHDWFHTKRVLANSIHIAKKENANLFVVQLAALLHDIADAKFHDGDETLGPKVASEFLKKFRSNDPTIGYNQRPKFKKNDAWPL